MICLGSADMSEYEGTMLENNKEAILGTMLGNQMTFVYKLPPHMKCNKLFWINCKTRQRDFEGKSVKKLLAIKHQSEIFADR